MKKYLKIKKIYGKNILVYIKSAFSFFKCENKLSKYCH